MLNVRMRLRFDEQLTGPDGVIEAALHGDGGRLVLDLDAMREIDERVGARETVARIIS